SGWRTRRSARRLAGAVLAMIGAHCLTSCMTAETEPSEPPDRSKESQAAAPANAAESAANPRVGPWQMQCFVDDELVLDLPEVYRTERQTRAGGWVYTTPDGTVIRGRITAGANCVWSRVEEDTVSTQSQGVER
ncbi:MAG: hypothetical protein AAGF58_10460, partial [Pseudomonadota bacterium]